MSHARLNEKSDHVIKKFKYDAESPWHFWPTKIGNVDRVFIPVYLTTLSKSEHAVYDNMLSLQTITAPVSYTAD